MPSKKSVKCAGKTKAGKNCKNYASAVASLVFNIVGSFRGIFASWTKET